MILLPTVLAKDPRYHAALYCFLEKSVRNERNIMAGKGKRVEAVGYMRTSSTTNVGDGKDSEARQRRAIEGYAKATGMVVVDWFYDAAVSGADAIEVRPGFAALLARIAGNGVRTIIVETANRFARDLMVQEVGFAMLRDLGVTLIAADSPSSFLDEGPTSKLIRQILGAVSEFDKAMIVAKLKGARDRLRRTQGKCEGRKAYAEREGGHELVAMARQLRGNCAAIQMAALNPFAGSLPIWPIMVTSRRAVGSIRLRQSPRCSGRRSLQPSSDRHACTRCVCRSAVSPPRRPALQGRGNLGRKAICKTLCPRMIQSPPRSRYSGFSGAAKPRGQSPRRIRPPVRFQVGGWGSSRLRSGTGHA